MFAAWNQSKVGASRKGAPTLFASGMEQTAMSSPSGVGFGAIGARCASVRLAGGQAWSVPCGRPQPRLITGQGPVPIVAIRTVGRSIPHGLGLRLPVVATASSTPAKRHARPSGRDVGARHGSPPPGAPEAFHGSPRGFITPTRRASVA